jgi:hypothetical protein
MFRRMCADHQVVIRHTQQPSPCSHNFFVSLHRRQDVNMLSMVNVTNIIFIYFYSNKYCVIRVLYLIIGFIVGVLLHTEM